MQNSDPVSTTLVMTRLTQDDFKMTNKKFSRRHSEKIKENNKNTNCNNTTNNNVNSNNLKHKCSLRNRRTLIPLVLPEQVDSQQLIDIDKNSLFILNNTATQSLFNLTKYDGNPLICAILTCISVSSKNAILLLLFLSYILHN